MIFDMVLSKNTFCWKNALATYIFPTQQKSIMLCDVDVSCICTHGRCHVMLTPLALTHMVGAARCRPNVLSSAAWPVVSPETEPRFPRHGAGNRGSVSNKTSRRQSVPNLVRPWVESSLLPFGCKLVSPPTRPKSGGQHGHTSSFATWPSPPAPTRPNPNSKRAVWILEFGVWILGFGVWILVFWFWILEFGFWIWGLGFWILAQFSLRSFCGGPKTGRFGFWILGLD